MSPVSRHKIVVLLLLLSLAMVACHRGDNIHEKDPVTINKLDKDDDSVKLETEFSDEKTIPDAKESGQTNSEETESDVVLDDETDTITEQDYFETESTEDSKLDGTENPFNLDENNDGFIDGWY